MHNRQKSIIFYAEIQNDIETMNATHANFQWYQRTNQTYQNFSLSEITRCKKISLWCHDNQQNVTRQPSCRDFDIPKSCAKLWLSTIKNKETMAKVRFKTLWTKSWDRYCYSTMSQIFLIQITFQSSDRVELDFWRSVIKIALNFKSRGTKKLNFTPKGPTTVKVWEMKLLLLLITNTQKFSSLLCWI